MICLAITIILVGCSSVISQELYEESGESQLDTSEEVFRLKLQTEDDDSEDLSQLKTIRNSEQYDVGKIFSHLQIIQRPRPVLNLRPIGGHTVIHKQNNKDHASHHDGYIPVKIPSDTEYVIKPQYNSHSHLHHGESIVKPGSHYHTPEYNHGEYNNGYNSYGYNIHGNGYNHHGHEHNDYKPIHQEYYNHGHDNHEYNSDKYPHNRPTHLNHHNGRPNNHSYKPSKPSTHGSYSHPPKPYIDSHYFNGHNGKPHGDYKPHHGHDYYGENGYHQDHKYENYHGDYKPHHGSYGDNGYHQDHKPYYHDNYGHLHHKHHEKPHPGHDFHHGNHRPYQNGYEYHFNSHSTHNKPHHNYEVHEHEDNSHHKPSSYYADHKPYNQHNFGHHDNYYSHHSSHKPIDNTRKPSKPTHKPHENYHYKPSKQTHGSHSDPHKFHGPSHHYGSLGEPHMSGVNAHKTEKHKDKPKNYQQQNHDEQIKSDLEYLIEEDRNDAVTYMEKLDSGSNLHRNTTDNHTKQDLHSTSAKPSSGSSQINKNTTHVAMNPHGDRIHGNTIPTQSGGHVGHIHVTKNEHTHKPSDSHIQYISKPNSKNPTPPMITQANTGNTLKPHPMTSYSKPKPILASTTIRPTISTNHESRPQLNSNRPEQKPYHIVPVYKPNGHHTNYYEVTEPSLETLHSANQDSTSIEESSNVHQLPLFKPNNEENSEAFVDNSQVQISSHENNHNKLHSSIEYVSGHQFNIPDTHYHDQHLYENHDYEHQHHGEESTDMSGEDQHGAYPQDNVHHSHSYHGNNPHRQNSHPQKPSYYPFHHSHSDNDRPNKCDSSHGQNLDEYHKEHYRPNYYQQSSHSNHHNFYGKPVSNHHTHQVSKPLNIDHGPYGVSGIFINNFKKRPNPWYDDGDSKYDSQETLNDAGYQEDYRESREDYREDSSFKRENGGDYREDSSFEKSIEREGEANYLSKPQTSENSGYKRLLNLVSKNSRENIIVNPHSRRNLYTDFNTLEEKSDSFVGNFKDRIPSTPEYDLENKDNKELSLEAEKALAYVVNPYAYVSRPYVVHHNGLHHTTHQNFILDPNHHHHQHGVYNHIQPHYGHQSNHHEYGFQNPHYHHSLGLETTHTMSHNPSIHHTGHHNSHHSNHHEYGFQNPHHHHSLGLETTHTMSHNPSIHHTGHHNSQVNNHGNLATSHSHNSNESPVKYVYIPVLYNFQPHIQEHVSHMSVPNSNTPTSTLKLNRSSADYFNRLALSELGTTMYDQKQVEKPTLEIFKSPTRVSFPMNTPQATRESSPLLLQIFSSPQPTYLDPFPENEDMISRDGKEYLRRVEPLEKEEPLKVENNESTSNWHETQELHEDYASKCKDIWDSILLAQETGSKKQERLFSRSNDEVSTALQDLERKVESLISKKKRSNTLESESVQDLQDSLESTCIEVLKNALLAQLEMLDIKRREEKINKNQSQSINKLEVDKEKLSDTVSQLEASESGHLELETGEHTNNDLPITFEKEQDGLNDREDEQENTNSSQDYHW